MESNKSVCKISALSAAIMLAYGIPALAEDDEVAQYIKPESTVSVGAGFQNNDRRQFGIFDGRQDNGASLLIDADIRRRDDATGIWNELKLINLGLDNREVSLGHSRQGDYGISFEYSRIPREVPYKVYSGLIGAGTETQTITQVNPGTGRKLELGTHRDRYTLGLSKLLGGDFEVSVKYRHEDKEGKRHFGTYTGAVAQFLVEPIDSTTRQLEAMLNYVGKDLQLQGGYYGSWFDNANQLISATRAGPVTNYISLPPDNMAHQLFLNGAYTFSPTTTGTLRVARTVATQDDDGVVDSLRAINPALVMAGFNGVKTKVVTKDVQLGLASHPVRNLSLVANLHYNDRDDRTPLVAYNAQPDRTTPHSFTNLNAKFEAAYRVLRDFRLLGGIYLEEKERSILFREINTVPAAPTNAGNWTVTTVANGGRRTPYRSKTDEVTYKGQATKNLTDELSASLALSHSKRTGSRFYWAEQQNLISPLHMADRERDKLGLKLDWSPAESISVQAQYAQTKDDYGTNDLNADRVHNGATLFGTGIKDGGAQLFSIDGSFALTKNWQLTAWYSRDDAQAKQYAFQNNFGADPIRKTNLRDVGESIGLGIKGKAAAKLTVGAEVQWNRTDSKYQQKNFTNQADLLENLPTITNKALRLSLNGTYELDKSSSVRVDAIHDRWATNDWTWLMWNNAQTALVPLVYNADGTTVVANNKQSTNSLAVRYIYKFQ